MGCVIFTNQPANYEKGEVVYLGNRLNQPPVKESVTYVLDGSITKEEAETLAKIVPYRLVVVCKKKPRFATSKNVLIAWKERGGLNLSRLIGGIKKYPQRGFVFKRLAKAPIPYLLSALRGGVANIQFWRLLAASNLVLPDSYTKSLFAYGVNSDTESMPTTKLAKEEEAILGMRKSDRHLTMILQNDIEFANEVREKSRDSIPKGMKKGMEVDSWV